MFKKLLLSTAICGAATAAVAADLPVRTAAPAPIAPVVLAQSWTGIYVGIQGGYAGDEFRYPLSAAINGTPITGRASVTSSGFLGGGTIGYNHQFGGFVAGIEADYSFSNVSGKVDLSANIGNQVGIGASAGSDLRYLGTVRGRLGYALFDRGLLYVTGGWAWGSVRSGADLGINGNGIALSRTNSVNGWTVGAGFEYMLTQNLSLKTEYLYADLGKGNLYSADYGNGSYARLDVDTRIHIVRAGLNYRFNWGAPAAVVAKY